MTKSTAHDALSGLCEALRSQVRSADRKEGRLTRFEVPVEEEVDVLSWLQAHPEWPKGYIASRGGDEEIAGVGHAYVASGFSIEDYEQTIATLHEILPTEPGARFYGGRRFAAGEPDEPEWMPFFSYGFVLPRVEISRRGDQCFLACHVDLGDDAEIERILTYLEQSAAIAPERDDVLRPTTGRTDEPSREKWIATVERAKQAIADGELEKVVLARKSTLEFEDDLNPLTLMRRLRAATPGCFHFCLIPFEGVAFLGASPERLYCRTGQHIESEAIAGTRPRGAGAEEDGRIGEELLQSAKDRDEHEYVVRGIKETLGPLLQNMEADAAPSIMKLARSLHLVTRLEGTLKDAVTDAEILAALHPTPAVGGYPRARAMEKISEWEDFDRGWYAGQVGWLGADAADMTVAIRCGLAVGSQLSLYSGAGIVADSDPVSEWDEIEQKISDFVKLLSDEG